MAIRSLTEIWIDANFKETQLADLRIGQPVDLDVDMYGSRQRFQGPHLRLHDGHRLDAGAAAAPRTRPATSSRSCSGCRCGSSCVDYDPDKTPLFIGLSVTPYVHVNEPPTGPERGQVAAAASPQPVAGADRRADRR